MDYKINFSGTSKRPMIAVVGCLHGNELVGKKVIHQLRKISLKNGSLITIIANEEAIKQKKRYIVQDLNRSFPGKKNGNHEEKLAQDILKSTKKADFVIDIHSTTTDVKTLAIITKKGKDVLNLAYALNPQKIVLMKKDIAKKAFINYCNVAVSLEYGKDDRESTYNETLKSIMAFLEAKKMIQSGNRNKKKNKVDFYKISGVVKKTQADVLKKNIKNFKLIRKGEVFAKRNGKKIIAKENFYPVLFGDRAYDNIFGFKAVRDGIKNK